MKTKNLHPGKTGGTQRKQPAEEHEQYKRQHYTHSVGEEASQTHQITSKPQKTCRMNSEKP